MKKILIFIIVYSIATLAQIPGSVFNPMTAPGAIGIDRYEHTLFWKNPLDVRYNECYFSSDSSLVANMDTSVRIQNGSPSTVFSSVTLTSLSRNTRYYWSIVEYNASGNSSTPVWYFNTQPYPAFSNEYQFDYDLEGWESFGPLGFNNWYWWFTSNAGSNPGEMVFRWDPVFIGDSYIISPEIPSPAGATVWIEFQFYEDWYSDTVVVGSAITSNNGHTWTSIWELHATGNVGPDYFCTMISVPGNFRLGFYYTGNSNNINFLYVDNISLSTTLTVSHPPSFLQAWASTTAKKITLNWNSGSSPDPITGYRIQKKNGLPQDSSSYITIEETNANTFTFYDEAVELNHNYTYRIATLSGPPGYSSHYGNDATAYVADVLTSVITESEPTSKFSLHQNYPNPFNPSTMIRYEIPGQARNDNLLVVLTVYDVLGNEIATLVNEEKPAGSYEVKFNTTNLPSGIYFYQLRAGSFVQIKKMILLK